MYELLVQLELPEQQVLLEQIELTELMVQTEQIEYLLYGYELMLDELLMHQMMQ